MEDTIEVVDYDPVWPDLFARERDQLADTLRLDPACLEHVGSTAVRGLVAKPTIDLMIGVEPLVVGDAEIRLMQGLGYVHMGEFGIPGRHFFHKGEPRSHHVHWVRRGADFWSKQLVFRDYLRSSPQACVPYARLKNDLAKRYSHDRPAYTAAKTDVIMRLQERAWLWAGAPLIVFDLEATCWKEGQSPERMETIEIGAVRLDSRLDPVDEFNTFVRPRDEGRLSDFCVELTSIGQQDVDAAVDFPSALRAFAAWAGGGLYRLASWSGYDLVQLRTDCARHGVALPAGLERFVDLRELYCRLRGAPSGRMIDALKGEGLAVQGRLHRGIDDARNASRLAKVVIGEFAL